MGRVQTSIIAATQCYLQYQLYVYFYFKFNHSEFDYVGIETFWSFSKIFLQMLVFYCDFGSNSLDCSLLSFCILVKRIQDHWPSYSIRKGSSAPSLSHENFCQEWHLGKIQILVLHLQIEESEESQWWNCNLWIGKMFFCWYTIFV